MKCPKCNEEIDDNSNFCQNCGEKIDTNSTSYCTKCGKEIETNNELCDNCRKKKNNKTIGLLIIIIVAAIILFSAITLITSPPTQEIVIPEGFVLESNESGVATYVEQSPKNGASPMKIDVQNANAPYKNYTTKYLGYTNKLIGKNSANYKIIVYHDDTGYNPYMMDMVDSSVRMRMKIIFEKMNEKGNWGLNLQNDITYTF